MRVRPRRGRPIHGVESFLAWRPRRVLLTLPSLDSLRHESVALAERLTDAFDALGTEVSVVQEQDVFNAAVFFPSTAKWCPSASCDEHSIARTLQTQRLCSYSCVRTCRWPGACLCVIDFSYHVRDLERMQNTYAHYQAIQGGKGRPKGEGGFQKWGAADDKSSTGEGVELLSSLR